MNITKCNKCKKDKPKRMCLLERDATWISGSTRGQGLNVYFDLCEECGTKLAKYIKKYFKLEASNAQKEK